MLHLVTIYSNPTKLEHLAKSIDHFSTFSNNKINYNMIHHIDWKNGNLEKIFVLKKFIEENTKDDDIICFTDAYDVIINSANLENELREKFKLQNCDLLISTELNCFPARYKNMYPNINHTTNHKYLNSGGFIGYKRAVYDLLNWKSEQDIINEYIDCHDQGYFTDYYINNYQSKNVKLDTNADIFLSMHLVDHSDIIFHKNQILNKALNNKPCFLHFNGKSFKNIHNMMHVFIQNVIASSQHDNIIKIDRKYKAYNRHIRQK